MTEGAPLRIIRTLHNEGERFHNPVLTLGNFDGVHLGHQAIFHKVAARARETGGTGIAFTFEPHPLKIIAPERSPRLLNTFHAKMKLIEATGIDIIICANFTRAFAEQDPDDFAREVLHRKIGVREVYVGYDYAFGKGREGSIESLSRAGRVHGFDVNVVEAVRVNGVVVSSTAVRDLLVAGKVGEAAKLLGRPYRIEGEVVHGAHRGRELGFPTANVRTANELVPGNGVYAVRILIQDRFFNGVASIGIRPTFDAGPVSVEVYIFDFQGDVYGEHLELSFIAHLRNEEKFSSVEALVQRIKGDVQQAKEALADAADGMVTKQADDDKDRCSRGGG